jgi:hypothetical protein
MTPERWSRIKDLFLRARLLARAERSRFFEAECPGDPDLFSEVSRLLRASERSPGESWLELASGGDAAKAVWQALDEIRAFDARLHGLAVLHFRSGLTRKEVVERLSIDDATFDSELLVYKAWMSVALGR